MTRTRKILFTIILCAALAAPFPPEHAVADVKITISFAVGGAACGVYLFFAYSSGFASDWQNVYMDSPALLNYSPEGWKIKPPMLQLAGDNMKNTVPYAEILRIRF